MGMPEARHSLDSDSQLKPIQLLTDGGVTFHFFWGKSILKTSQSLPPPSRRGGHFHFPLHFLHEFQRKTNSGAFGAVHFTSLRGRSHPPPGFAPAPPPPGGRDSRAQTNQSQGEKIQPVTTPSGEWPPLSNCLLRPFAINIEHFIMWAS